MRLRPLVLAVTLSLPLAVLPVGIAVHAQPRPVTPELRAVDLEVVAAAATTNRTGSVQRQTEPTALQQEVAVVGVTWDGAEGAAQDVAVQVRQQVDGTWGPWDALEAEDAGEGDRRGTEPLVVVGADAVQARLTSGARVVVGSPRLTVIDPGTSPADADPAPRTAGSADAAVARPTVLTRAQWGADESLRRGSPTYSPVRAAVIHHTAGTNSYTGEQVPAVLRGIYAYHVQARGWSDVGYNMLADRFGRLWEGRAGGIDRGVVGAHVSGYNTGSFGISVMGTFDTAAPPAATQTALAKAIAWKLDAAGVSVNATVSLGGRSVPAVVAHRDLGQTACPGAAFYARMGAIRSAAASLQAAGGGPSPAPAPTPTPTPTPTPAPSPALVPESSEGHDLDGDGHPDVVTSGTSVGVAVRVPSPVLPAVKIGQNWSRTQLAVGSPDLGGDGRPDVVARAATGALWLYESDGRGGFASSRQIGSSWGAMVELVAPGDWDGDGRADLLGITSTGTMYLYRGTGAGRLLSGTPVGWGWGSMREVVGAGDLDRDGRRDLVALDGTGTVRTYSGNGRGGFLRSTVLAGDWADVDAVLGVGDWDRDGRPDLMTRGRDGRMSTRFSAATGTAGTLEAPSTWGNGWGGSSALVGPGDWDGDGRSDVLAVSRADGAMRLYRGTGARDFAAAAPLSVAVPQVRDTLVVGDVDGNGRADLVLRDDQDDLFISFVQGRAAIASTRQIGWNWGQLDLLTAAGDLSADGVPDLVARHRTTGALLLFTLGRNGSITRQEQIGNGWGGMDLLVGAGPFDDGPTADLLARRASDGALVLYTGTGTGRLGSTRQVGYRWGGVSELVGIRDHDGDGSADLLARTAAGTHLVYLGNGVGGFLGSRQVLGIPLTGRLS